MTVGNALQLALTIQSGATVNASNAWSLGAVPPSCVSGITINGGVLNFTGPSGGGGTAASTITMTGGTISGVLPDWYNGINSTPTLVTNASNTTAVISSGVNLRLSAGNLTFNVALGTTPSGVDLLVSGPITSGGGGGIIKAGAGLLCLSAANSYTGATTISGGTLNLTGSLANLSVTVNGANTAFNESATGVVAGGGATFTLTSGSATLSGANTYGARPRSAAAVRCNWATVARRVRCPPPVPSPTTAA